MLRTQKWANASLLGHAWHLAWMFHRPIRKVLSKETIHLFLKTQNPPFFQDGQGQTLMIYCSTEQKHVSTNRVFRYARPSSVASKVKDDR